MQTYKELQLNLKAFKSVGHVLLVKLNAKREVLEQEYIRLQMVEQLEYADTQSELPQLEEVEEEMSILSLEGVSSLTAQYSLASDTTEVNTTKGKVFDDLWESTEGESIACMQEIVDVPMCYQLCLPPAPDSIQERVPHMVHPLIVFLLPVVMVLLILNLSIKVLNKVLQFTIPFVLQRCKPKLKGYFSTRDRGLLFT